jgi:hypothetical protein
LVDGSDEMVDAGALMDDHGVAVPSVVIAGGAPLFVGGTASAVDEAFRAAERARVTSGIFVISGDVYAGGVLDCEVSNDEILEGEILRGKFRKERFGWGKQTSDC